MLVKSLKNIVWGFDLFTFCEPANTPHPQRIFPFELYQNDYKKYFLLFDWAFVRQSFKRLILFLQRYKSNFKFYENLKDLYYYWDWPEIQAMYESFISSEKLNEIRKDFPDYASLQSIFSEKFSSVDIHLLPIIGNHPEIQFHFLITPISWTCFNDITKVQKYFSLQKYLVLSLKKYKNIHIHGFHDCAFVSNLANYYNESHYHPEVNRYMLYSIKHNLHRLTVENIDKYEQRMLKNLKSFEIKENYSHRDSLEDLIQQNSGL